MKRKADNKDRVILYIDGQLDADEEAEFRRELGSSPGLKKDYENYLNMLEAIRAQKDLSLDERYLSGIIPKFRENFSAREKSARYIPKLAIAVAMVAVILITIFNPDRMKNSNIPSFQNIVSQLKSDELTQALSYYTEENGYSDITGYYPAQSDSVVSTMLSQELNLSSSDLDYVSGGNTNYDYSSLLKNADKADIELVYNQLLKEKF
jgi:hypothetical protein